MEAADIIITATGNKDVITVAHMSSIKEKVMIGNDGEGGAEICGSI